MEIQKGKIYGVITKENQKPNQKNPKKQQHDKLGFDYLDFDNEREESTVQAGGLREQSFGDCNEHNILGRQ